VIVDEDNRIHLIDFGIGDYIWPGYRCPNNTPMSIMGYSPPELFSGKIEARSDIYSLGAVLFHLLTGRNPGDDPLMTFDFSRKPKPRMINPKLTVGIEEIIMKAVEHKPERRFVSADQMKTALENHLCALDSAGVDPKPESTRSKLNTFCGHGWCRQMINPSDRFCKYCGTPKS
jgi:eukaryotic-like serine/threonine-protein kinase